MVKERDEKDLRGEKRRKKMMIKKKRILYLQYVERQVTTNRKIKIFFL